MNEHITKPINPDELYRVLAHWLVHGSENTITPTMTPQDNYILLPDYSENLDAEWGLKRVGAPSYLMKHLGLLSPNIHSHTERIG